MRAVRVPAARPLAASLLCLASLAFISCGGDDAKPRGVGEEGDGIGRQLQTFTCADWNRADLETRLAVLRRLREENSGPIVGGRTRGRGAVLTDRDARQLFENHCRHDYARGFVLYKLYGQAVGLAGVDPRK